MILGCPIKIVLRWFSQETDDLNENKRCYGIPDILGSIPIGRGCLKVVLWANLYTYVLLRSSKFR